MDAGQLDQRLTLQQKSTTTNGFGEDVVTWNDVATVWAKAAPLRGREFSSAAETQSSAEVRFTVRFRDDVDETWRLMWRGKAYALVAPPINVGGTREWLEMMCQSGVRDG
jgi:SPP1 family predicted phage head-tail adaptor